MDGTKSSSLCCIESTSGYHQVDLVENRDAHISIDLLVMLYLVKDTSNSMDCGIPLIVVAADQCPGLHLLHLINYQT